MELPPTGKIIDRPKKDGGYFNYQRRTPSDLFHDAAQKGLSPAIGEHLTWAKMRMDPINFADVTGVTYHYLMMAFHPTQTGPVSLPLENVFGSGSSLRER